MNKLVCMGDSITYGEFVPSEHAWPTLLRNRIPDWRILNRGVCGDTTRLGLERFPRDVQRERPNTVIVQFGLNDYNCWESDEGLPRVSPKAFVANLHEMVARARRFGVADIYLMTPHHTSSSAQVAAAIRDVFLCYEGSETFEGHSGVHLIDIRAQVHGPVTLDDNVHLNEFGHRAYADVIARTL